MAEGRGEARVASSVFVIDLEYQRSRTYDEDASIHCSVRREVRPSFADLLSYVSSFIF